VLTFGWAGAHRALRSVSFSGAVLALSIMAPATFSSAQAQVVHSGGCVGARNSFNCVSRWAPAGDPYVRDVPQPHDAAGRALKREHERRWADRCHPTIVQDRYGVPRYQYALPGCEFGVGEY
jgi:hypothetical protein